jgi:hypothetical protein
LWGPERADFQAADAIVATAADGVVTSLAAAIAEIEAALTESRIPAIGQRRLARESA